MPAGFLLLSILAPAQDRSWRPVDPQDLQMKEIKQVPGAEGVLLYYADEIDDVSHSEFFYSRIKIFTDGGKHRANVEIPMTEKNSVTGLLGRTIHPDGKIVDMVERPFEKVVFKGKGVRVKVQAFTLPQVGAGDIIEYQYELHYGDRGLRHHHWTIQQDLFAQKEHFSFRYDKHFGVRWLPTAGMQLSPVNDAKVGILQMDSENVPPFEPEEQMPPEDDYKWQIRFFYVTPFMSSPTAYWYETGRWSSRAIDEYIGKHKEIVSAATDAMGTETDPEKKLRMLYARAQEIRNLTYERRRTEKEQKIEDLKENKNVMDVLRHGYGHRNDITLFFIALARGAGFTTSAVFVSGRSTRLFDREVLSFSQLDSEVAMVNLNGKKVFLDPGTRYCPYGLMRWFRTGTSAMDMSDPGQFISTPRTGEDSAIVFRSAELKLGVDGAVKGEVRIDFYGAEALERRLSALETDEAGRKKELEEELKFLLPANATVEMTNSMRWDKEDESLLAIFHVEVPEFASAAGKRILIPVAFFQPRYKRTLKTGPRKYPVYYPYAYTEQDNISLELPQGYALETLATPQNTKTDFAKYSSSASSTKNYLNLQRSFKFSGVFFPVSSYEDLRGFFAKVQAGDELQTVLRQEPAAAAAQPN